MASKSSRSTNLNMTTPEMPISDEIQGAFAKLVASGAAKPAMRRLLEQTASAVESADAPWLADIDAFVDETNREAAQNFAGSFSR